MVSIRFVVPLLLVTIPYSGSMAKDCSDSVTEGLFRMGKPLCGSVDFKNQATDYEKMLKGNKVFFYNFIDVRESEIGYRAAEETSRLLIEEMKNNSIVAEAVQFRDSRTAMGFLSARHTGGSYVGGWGSQTEYHSDLIPVEQVIQENSQAEKEFGAKYRLLGFPVNYTVSGLWQFYHIRWDLVDIETGKKVWQFDYHGRHLKLGDNAESRAKKFVDKLMQKLRQSKMF